MTKPKHNTSLRRKSSRKLFQKRSFRGNQHLKKDVADPNIASGNGSSSFVSASAKKIKSSTPVRVLSSINPVTEPTATPTAAPPSAARNSDNSVIDNDSASCFLMIDSDILQSFLDLLGVCPECGIKSIYYVDWVTHLSRKKGL